MVFCGAHQHTISHIYHSHPTTAIESHRNVYHSVTALMRGDKSATMTDTFWFSQHLPDLGFSVSVHCLTKQLKIRLLGCIQTLGLLRRRAEAVAVDVRQISATLQCLKSCARFYPQQGILRVIWTISNFSGWTVRSENHTDVDVEVAMQSKYVSLRAESEHLSIAIYPTQHFLFTEKKKRNCLILNSFCAHGVIPKHIGVKQCPALRLNFS